MKIIFVGQDGFSGRTETLAAYLAGLGHAVTVFGKAADIPHSMKNFQGIQLRRMRASWLAVLQIWSGRPGAIHVTGWSWAAGLIFCRWLLPETTIIWTLESLPKTWKAWRAALLRRAAKAADSITVPTRAVQWEVLSRTEIRAWYIPDGFHPAQESLPSIRRWKLWRGRYGVTCAASQDDIGWVAEAWRESGTRKKLVVIGDIPQLTQAFLKGKYPLLMFRTGGSRVRQALFSGAQLIITPSRDITPDIFFEAMISNRPIISTTQPLQEELYGTTAAYVREGDGAALASLIVSLGGQPQAGKATPAQKRAVTFFRWERIFMEYLPLYSQLREIVPLDSAHSVTFTKPAVQ